MKIYNTFLMVLLVLCALPNGAQEIPPIQIFTPEDYHAEDQNWSIAQAQNNFIYAANNKGLLEFNGANWKLYNSPNEAVIRAVEVVGDKIYSGGYMDFGFWERNEFGNLEYNSLAPLINKPILEDEEFWGIISVEEYVLFQSFERIYIYNALDKSFAIIDSEIRIDAIFEVNGTVFFQKRDDGIFKIENGKEVLVIDSERIKNKALVNIFDFGSGLLLQTKEHGFFTYVAGDLSRWEIKADQLLMNSSVYSSLRLRDGSFVLGTISNGLVMLNDAGGIMLRIDQSYGLSNNTVLSMHEDNYGNLWLGLDNGINVINLNSPYRVYTDKLGILGTVYAAEKVGDTLYLGTNQGLFYKRLTSNEQFQLVEGTKGQVWDLQRIGDQLFCGHDKGTFIITDGKVEKVADEMGTWAIKKIQGQPNLLIQGNYKGLNMLQRIDGQWAYRNKIDGFDISTRHFEFTFPDEIIVNHEYKGVYRLKIDEKFESVITYEKLNVKKGIKSSIIKYKDTILYAYRDGVYSYDPIKRTFSKDSLLSSHLVGSNYVSGKLIYDEEANRLWGFSENDILYVEPGILSNELEIKSIPIPNTIRQSKSGYENLLLLDPDTYLIGTTNGYLIINLDKINITPKEIYLNEVLYRTNSNGYESLAQDGNGTLAPNNNSIKFNYSVPNFNKLSASKYQYKLTGIYDSWSSWSSESEVFFENLPPGDYVFQARAKTNGKVSSNVLSYEFNVDKPWYLKPLAITFYVIALLFILFLSQYFNRRYYKKQKLKLIDKKEKELELEQLENQRQLMQVKNENLQLDIENKNRELGMATMNLVKRNELLNSIKEKLSKSDSTDQFKDVIKLINANLNNTSDWKLFEEAFNNVDKDFMKKIKQLHPSITPNDLRLCAYLRLNLSSKEIAPLLNISHKSVEVKRYRLRKKMDLDHEQSLSNYIIEL